MTRLFLPGLVAALVLVLAPATAEAASVVNVDGPLVSMISNASEANALTVTSDGSMIVLSDGAGLTLGTSAGIAGCTIAGNVARCPLAGMTEIELGAGPGNDTLNVGGSPLQTRVGLGTGDDRLTYAIGAVRPNVIVNDDGGIDTATVTGTGAADRFLYTTGGGLLLDGASILNNTIAFEEFTLDAAAGDDTLDARAALGDGRFIGGTGNDTARFGAARTWRYDGDAGTDKVVLDGRASADVFSFQMVLGRFSGSFTRGGSTSMLGVEQLDLNLLAGNDKATFLRNLGRAAPSGTTAIVVTVRGGLGNDLITGSVGAERIHGDAGNDVIHAGGGNDHVTGGAGNDLLWGNKGDDRVEGGAGTDKLYGDDGADVLIGGAGRDGLFGGSGTNTLIQ